MTNLTTEKLEEILEMKLEAVLRPLSSQINEILEMVSALNVKYNEISKSIKDLEKDKNTSMNECSSLKEKVFTATNDLKLLTQK